MKHKHTVMCIPIKLYTQRKLPSGNTIGKNLWWPQVLSVVQINIDFVVMEFD